MKTVDIKTNDGVIDCYAFSPEAKNNLPVIIIYMDAFGVRQSLYNMAERFSNEGYYVILPNLFYRAGEFAPFTTSAFNDETERARLMKIMQSINISKVMDDTGFIIKYLNENKLADISKIGVIGYCMGGKFALASSAYFPESVIAAASIHGGGLATVKHDSPHLLATKMKAKIYVGIAEIDRGFTSEEKERLVSALKSSGVDFSLEIYPGAMHGFAIADHSVYDKDSAEMHWKKLLNLFAKTLKKV